MRSITIAVLALALVPTAGAAQGGDRLNDQQLTRLVEDIGKSFDHWKDDLERRNLDDAKISNASGVIDVKKFIGDMKKDIETVDGRLKSSYAANPEVTAMLRRASDVERRYAAQPQGAPEAWMGLSGQLKALAAAYGLSWPVDTAAANAQRRMDGELASEVKRLADAADQLRNVALKAASTAKQPKTQRDDAFDEGVEEGRRAARRQPQRPSGGAPRCDAHARAHAEIARLRQDRRPDAAGRNGRDEHDQRCDAARDDGVLVAEALK